MPQSPVSGVYQNILALWLPAQNPQQEKLLPGPLVASLVSPPPWIIISGGTAAGLPPPTTYPSDTYDIVSLAWQQLQDLTGIKWDYTKLIPYLNYAILEILTLKPEALPSTVAITLAPGPTQALPPTAIALLDAGYNLLPDGITYGNAITVIDKEVMDEVLPGWTSFPAVLVVQYLVYDRKNPKVFYVFPPQPPSPPGPGTISSILSMPPTKLTDFTSTFPLDVSYKPACVNYLVYRALAEETTIPNALNKSTMFHNEFYKALGLKTNVEQSRNPEGT